MNLSLLVIAFIGLTGIVWAWLAPAGKAQPSPPAIIASASLPVSTQESASGERLEAEIITITRTGFEPAEITRSEGRFLLAIQDRSGLAELKLRVSREGEGAQFLVPTLKKRRVWRDVVNPPRGRYLLTEANHPEWRCLIAIE
jgi:hypothetical protein